MDEWSQIELLNVAQSSECGVRTRHPKPPPSIGAALTEFSLYWCIRTPTVNHYINREQNRWTRTDRARAQSLFTTIFLGGQNCTITSLF